MTTADKLAHLRVNCAFIGSGCKGCKLELGTTCPEKPWTDWTDEEIEIAYNVLSHGGKEPEFVKAGDSVEHPLHYTQNGIECIEAIKASMTADGFMDYCKGNVLKYLWRWRDKGGAEDLEKARIYLNWMIEEAEK